MPRRNYVPRSLAAFPIVLLGFMLQMEPNFGFLLLFFLAPYWSVVLINFGMIGTAFEVATGLVHRAWLVLPATFYGAYAVYAAMGQHSAARLEAEATAAHELALATPADVVGHPIVAGSEKLAQELFDNFDIPQIYWLDEKTRRHRVQRIAPGDFCGEVARRNPGPDVSFKGARGRVGTKHGCVYSLPAEPRAPFVTIGDTEGPAKEPLGVNVTEHRVTIRDAGGKTISFIHGTLAARGLVPLPIIGCWPENGMYGWKCHATFDAPDNRTIGPERLDALAALLGIRKGPRADVVATGEAWSDPDLDSWPRREVEASVADLDRALSDPTFDLSERTWTLAAPSLAADPRRIERLAASLTVRVTRDWWIGNKTTGHFLASLLAAPDEDLAPHVEPVAKAFEAAVGNHWYQATWARIPDDLHLFLRNQNDITAKIVPFLLQSRSVVVRQRLLDFVCSSEAPRTIGAGAAAEIAAIQNDSTLEMGQRSDAYAALLRIGRPDLAELVPPKDSPYRKIYLQNMRQTVSPASKATNCGFYMGY